ncbi:MAG: hypothetical protein ACXWC9_06350, partial [Pseudobdellovibrionaceae bacterium]
LKKELGGISPEEIRQYLKTQDADQKLRKADEILGKIMQLLVAQVGYRLQKEDLDQFGKMPERVDNQPPPAPVAKVPAPVEAPTAEARTSGPRLTVQINGAQNETQVQRVLSGLGTNFTQRLQQASVLNDEQVQNLNGSFEGSIVYDKDQKVQRAVMTFAAELVDGKLNGSWSMEVFKLPGKSSGRSSGRGNLTKDFSGNANEIFIEQGSAYFQLVYFPRLDQWIGNFLENDKGRYNKVGTAIFRRR